ncbi:MAG: hypothetical protein H0W82_05460 [Actinobacteria bacterium]|nr:hypothetical protein [Actinomycetota bacterium]
MVGVTPPIAPDRSLEQRRAAIVEANRIRRERAALKSAMRRAGRSRAAEIVMEEVRDPSPFARTWKLSALLAAIPHLGESRVAVALALTGCSHVKTLAGLTDRQREAVCNWLTRFVEPVHDQEALVKAPAA